MKELKLMPGDVILQDYHHPNRFLNFILCLQDYFDWDRWNHALIYYKDGLALEAQFNGIMFRKIKLDKDYKVIRLYQKLDHEFMIKVIDEYYFSIGKGYGYVSLLNASLGVLTRYFFGKKLQLLRETIQPYCSELVLEILHKYGIITNVNDDIVTPNDLDRMEIFKVIYGGDSDVNVPDTVQG